MFEKTHVKELEGSDFAHIPPTKLKKGFTGIVMFYLPGCHYCTKSKKAYAEAAAVIKKYCSFYALNAERYPRAINRIRENIPSFVQGFPTFVLYRKGVPIKHYVGDRSKKSFVMEALNLCVENAVSGYKN